MTTTLVAVATRKGLWFYRSTDRRTWAVDGPHHFGAMVHHAVLDPRDGRTMLAATRTGHLGPALMRSTDAGRTWAQVKAPPAWWPALPSVNAGGGDRKASSRSLKGNP